MDPFERVMETPGSMRGSLKNYHGGTEFFLFFVGGGEAEMHMKSLWCSASAGLERPCPYKAEGGFVGGLEYGVPWKGGLGQSGGTPKVPPPFLEH